MVISQRYHRQEIIKDWNQTKLRDTSVTLVGSERLSDFILIDLLSFGFGNIFRIGRSDFFEFDRINPEVYLEQKEEELSSIQASELLLNEGSIIIDATNNLRSKIFSSLVAKSRNIPYISASATTSGFSILFDKYAEQLTEQESFCNKEQGSINSMICSAIAVDELRKRIMGLEDDILLGDFNQTGPTERKCLEKRILQIGAGAIGTFSSLALSLLGAELTIVDFDRVEETNLNRQFLFYERIGENKAIALSKRLKKYSEKIKPVDEKIGENFDPRNYDFVLSCVDNVKARYFMNQACSRYNVPLIDGGSSQNAGSAIPFIPGKTACLDCQTGFKLSEGVKEDPKKRKSGECFHPTLITPNQIVAGMMINCLSKTLDENYEKSNYSSGSGIYYQKVNKGCFDVCQNKNTK